MRGVFYKVQLIVLLFAWSFDTSGGDLVYPARSLRVAPYFPQETDECMALFARATRDAHAIWKAEVDALPRPKWMEEVTSQSPEWRRLIQRNPDEGAPQPGFLDNSHYSARFTDHWINRRIDVPFDEFLKRQYVFLILGRDGSVPYSGITYPRNQEVLLGFGRRDAFKEPFYPELLYPFSQKVAYQDGLPLRIRNLRPGETISIPMTGIRKQAFPRIHRVEKDEDTLELTYPRAKFVPQYLEHLRKTSERIRILLEKPDGKRRVQQLLAAYVQKSIIAHPYPSGNSSLPHIFLVTVLKNSESEVRLPRYLDHYGYVLTLTDFEEYLFSQMKDL